MTRSARASCDHRFPSQQVMPRSTRTHTRTCTRTLTHMRAPPPPPRAHTHTQSVTYTHHLEVLFDVEFVLERLRALRVPQVVARVCMGDRRHEYMAVEHMHAHVCTCTHARTCGIRIGTKGTRLEPEQAARAGAHDAQRREQRLPRVPAHEAPEATERGTQDGRRHGVQQEPPRARAGGWHPLLEEGCSSAAALLTYSPACRVRGQEYLSPFPCRRPRRRARS